MQVDARLTDVAVLHESDDEDETARLNGETPSAALERLQQKHTLLAAVQRCNVHSMRDYLPVFIDVSQVSFLECNERCLVATCSVQVLGRQRALQLSP